MKILLNLLVGCMLVLTIGCSSSDTEERANEEIDNAMEELDEAMEEVDDAMEQVEDVMEEVELVLEDVPVIVQEALETALSETQSSIDEVRWEMERGFFEAEFEIDGKELGIYFDEQGVIVAREEKIPADELPEEVMATLEREYQDFEIDEVERIKSDEEVLYEIELESKRIEAEILIDEDGNIREKYEEYAEDKDY